MEELYSKKLAWMFVCPWGATEVFLAQIKLLLLLLLLFALFTWWLIQHCRSIVCDLLQSLEEEGSGLKGSNSTAVWKVRQCYAACMNTTAIEQLASSPLLEVICRTMMLVLLFYFCLRICNALLILYPVLGIFGPWAIIQWKQHLGGWYSHLVINVQ